LGVIYLNHIDKRLQIGFAERHRAGTEVFAHGAAELLDQCRIDLDW
jgi:hypothetical protein